MGLQRFESLAIKSTEIAEITSNKIRCYLGMPVLYLFIQGCRTLSKNKKGSSFFIAKSWGHVPPVPSVPKPMCLYDHETYHCYQNRTTFPGEDSWHFLEKQKDLSSKGYEHLRSNLPLSWLKFSLVNCMHNLSLLSAKNAKDIEEFQKIELQVCYYNILSTTACLFQF